MCIRDRVYGLGGWLAFTGAIGTGTVVSLGFLLTRLYSPLTALTNARVDVMSALVSFERVFEVLDLRPSITETERPTPLPDGPLPRLTERTLGSLRALETHGELVRSRGYATTIDELELGLSGVATPVRDPQGEVVAALGVSGPTTRLHDRLEEIGHWLAERSDQLTALLRRRTTKEGVA